MPLLAVAYAFSRDFPVIGRRDWTRTNDPHHVKGGTTRNNKAQWRLYTRTIDRIAGGSLENKKGAPPYDGAPCGSVPVTTRTKSGLTSAARVLRDLGLPVTTQTTSGLTDAGSGNPAPRVPVTTQTSSGLTSICLMAGAHGGSSNHSNYEWLDLAR